MKKHIIDTIFQSIFLGLNVVGYFLPLLVNNHIYTTYDSMLEQPYGLTILGTYLFITIGYILYGYFIPDKKRYAVLVNVCISYAFGLLSLSYVYISTSYVYNQHLSLGYASFYMLCISLLFNTYYLKQEWMLKMIGVQIKE
jgi:hypothetical protein